MSPECQGWFKSSFSGSAADCVEVQIVDGDSGVEARVRNSRRPDGPVLVFDRGEWEAFELGVFNGEFRMPRLEERKAGESGLRESGFRELEAGEAGAEAGGARAEAR